MTAIGIAPNKEYEDAFAAELQPSSEQPLNEQVFVTELRWRKITLAISGWIIGVVSIVLAAAVAIGASGGVKPGAQPVRVDGLEVKAPISEPVVSEEADQSVSDDETTRVGNTQRVANANAQPVESTESDTSATLSELAFVESDESVPDLEESTPPEEIELVASRVSIEEPSEVEDAAESAASQLETKEIEDAAEPVASQLEIEEPSLTEESASGLEPVLADDLEDDGSRSDDEDSTREDDSGLDVSELTETTEGLPADVADPDVVEPTDTVNDPEPENLVGSRA